MFGNIHEECGVFGIFEKRLPMLPDRLISLFLPCSTEVRKAAVLL